LGVKDEFKMGVKVPPLLGEVSRGLITLLSLSLFERRFPQLCPDLPHGSGYLLSHTIQSRELSGYDRHPDVS
jgi:hypothetical protein